MSASDTRAEKRLVGRTAIIYVCITFFCALFSAVYEHYSHEVYSDFMVYLFLFPLVGGALPFTVMGLIKSFKSPSPVSMRIYNSGIAALTLGSCIKGVFDIYGTSSAYVNIYWISGALLICTAVISWICNKSLPKEASDN